MVEQPAGPFIEDSWHMKSIVAVVFSSSARRCARMSERYRSGSHLQAPRIWLGLPDSSVFPVPFLRLANDSVGCFREIKNKGGPRVPDLALTHEFLSRCRAWRVSCREGRHCVNGKALVEDGAFPKSLDEPHSSTGKQFCVARIRA